MRSHDRPARAMALPAVLLTLLVASGCGSLPPPSGALGEFATTARTPEPTDAAVASTPRTEPPPTPLVASTPRTGPAPPPIPPPPPASLPGAPCRLPLAYISEAYGLFLDYPSGAVEQDAPNSEAALPGNKPGEIGVNPGLTYLAATGTWVPAPRAWVAPGGAWYAYEDFNQHTIYGVAIPGNTRTTLTQAAADWNLFAVDDGGAYATQIGAAGAWFLPFDGGPAVPVVDHGQWTDLNGGALWSADPNTFVLTRYDLATSVETTWATFATRHDIKGFDGAGRPLVEEGPYVEGGDFTLSQVDQGGAMTALWHGQNDWVGRGIVSDSHGLWLESRAGIFLKTPTGGPMLIAGGYVGHPAGPCL
jgi:hypothetical protein